MSWCSLGAKFSNMESRRTTVEDPHTKKEQMITETFAYRDVLLKIKESNGQDPKTGKLRFKVQEVTHRIEFKVTTELAQEAMVIMHALAHCLEDELNKRFVHPGVVTDLLAIWKAAVKHDEQKSHPPDEVLERVAKVIKVEHDDFKKAWKELHMCKEVQMTKLLKERQIHREDIKIDWVWPTVLNKLEESDECRIAAAKPALELLLLLEAKNCGVERDAALKRHLKIIMHGNGHSDTVDSRLRVLAEGPSLASAKGSAGFHNVLYEAAQEFLRAKKRHDAATAKPRKPHGELSEDHKASLSKAAVTSKMSHVDEAPSGLRVPIAKTGDYEVVEMPEDFEAENLFDNIADVAASSSGYASTQKPIPKAKKQAGKLTPMDRMPKTDPVKATGADEPAEGAGDEAGDPHEGESEYSSASHESDE